MNSCPITYAPLRWGSRYSIEGLQRFSPRLHMLQDLPFTMQELHFEIAARAGKMSIPGTQPKLSARLDLAGQQFEITDSGGRYILKLQSPAAPHLPENEDLTMRLAEAAGLEIPFHGLLFCKDGSMAYCVRRFDRHGRHERVAVEDFAQLAGKTRFEKYDSTMEHITTIIDTYCTFPLLEKLKLFRLVLFNLLVGNDDLHLKNLALIRRDGKIELSPVYDLISTALASGSNERDLALPLAGTRTGVTHDLLVNYFGREVLGIQPKVIGRIVSELSALSSQWETLIDASFLTDEEKTSYRSLLADRRYRFNPLPFKEKA